MKPFNVVSGPNIESWGERAHPLAEVAGIVPRAREYLFRIQLTTTSVWVRVFIREEALPSFLVGGGRELGLTTFTPSQAFAWLVSSGHADYVYNADKEWLRVFVRSDRSYLTLAQLHAPSWLDEELQRWTEEA